MSEPTSIERKPGDGRGDDSCPVEHFEALAGDWGALLASPDFSDVTFVVEGERIHAHRLVLAARCEYFRAMLYGGLKESSETEVQLEGTNALAFRTLLEYIYTGKIELSTFKVEELVAILQLAHEYRLLKIQRPIVDYLKMMLDMSNAFTILRISSLFDDLKEHCLQLADQRAPEILTSQDFVTLQQKTMEDMLSRDSFYADEIDIFKAICQWIRAQSTAERTSLDVIVESFISKKCLRLDLMHPTELLSTVRHSELFEGNSSTLEKFILDALERRCQGTVSDIRGALVLDENVATAELGALVVEGENRETLLSGAQGSDGNISLTRHRIGQPEGIVVQLGRPYTINSVILQIGESGRDTIRSYEIEVSMDRREWRTVFFYSTDCQCFPLKEVVFNACLVRYIRVLGGSSTSGYFSLVSFKALFSTRQTRLSTSWVWSRKV